MCTLLMLKRLLVEARKIVCRIINPMSEEIRPAKKLKITESPLKQVTNDDCGITEYITTTPGFKGILKHRYSDFIVHEIDLQGNLVKLTSLDPPEKGKVEKKPDVDTSAQKELLSSHLSADLITALESIVPGSKDSPAVNIPVDGLDKDTRRSIHGAITAVYPHLFTVTKDIKDSSGKMVKMIAAGTTNSWRGKVDDYWSTAPGKFVHFTVHQENFGSFSVTQKLAEKCHLPIRSFSYAGTKDKRSVSSQRMSIFKGRPENLLRFNSIWKDQTPAIAVGNISFADEPLRLGQLKGNRFTIVYRDVEVESNDFLTKIFDEVSTKGFINYFGQQRFGAGTHRSDEVGLMILRQQWKQVVMAIMCPKFRDIIPRNADLPSFNTAMKRFQEDPASAPEILRKFTWKHTNEGILLSELAKYPNNFKNAFLRLPRNSRTLYLHAYQSKLWNRIVSYRINKYSNAVLIGDLVSMNDTPDLPIEDLASAEESVAHTSQPTEEAETQVDGQSKPYSKFSITFIDESNINQFSIFDVVLPLLGTETELPKNELGTKILEYLKEDGLTPKDFSDIQTGFNFFGSYRKVLVKPTELTWKTVKYTDDKIRLVPSDLDVLRNVQAPSEECSDESSKTALIVTVSLPSSSYATMFSREIMKEHLITNSI